MCADITDSQLETLSQRWADDPTPHVALQLADLHRQRGHIERAVPILERGLERHPGHVSLQVALGRCLLETADAAGAASVLRGVVDKDPGHLVANKLLVRAHLALGDRQAAEDRLALYTLLNDSDPDLAALRATVEGAPRAPRESSRPPALPEAFGATPARPETDLLSLARPGLRRVTGALDRNPFGELSADSLRSQALPDLFRRDEREEPSWMGGLDAAPEEAPIEPEASLGSVAQPTGEPAWEPVAQAEGAEKLAAADGASALESQTLQPSAPMELEAGAGETATLGALYLAQGHLADARLTFERVLERDPDDAEARAGLTEIARRSSAPPAEAPSVDSPQITKIARLEQYLSRIRAAAERLSA